MDIKQNGHKTKWTQMDNKWTINGQQMDNKMDTNTSKTHENKIRK